MLNRRLKEPLISLRLKVWRDEPVVERRQGEREGADGRWRLGGGRPSAKEFLFVSGEAEGPLGRLHEVVCATDNEGETVDTERVEDDVGLDGRSYGEGETTLEVEVVRTSFKYLQCMYGSI